MFDHERPHEDARRSLSAAAIATLVKALNAISLVITNLLAPYRTAANAYAEFLAKNEHILKPSPRDMTWNVLMILGVAVLYTLDVIVFGSAAAHLVRRSFSYVPVITEVVSVVARFVVPFLILGAELMVGSQVHRCGDRTSKQFNRAAQIAWAISGIVIAGAVTAMVLSLDLAGKAVGEQADGGVTFDQMVYFALAGLTLVLHVVVLFLGERGAAAKDFVVAKLTERKLRKAVEKAKAPYDRKDAEFVDLATEYLQAVQSHVQAFRERVTFGTLCDEALVFFREHFPHLRLADRASKPAVPTTTAGDGGAIPVDDEGGVVVDLPRDRFRHEPYPGAKN